MAKLTKAHNHSPKLAASLAAIVAKLEALPEPLRGPFIVRGLRPYATKAHEAGQ